jgi:hypothetical protein
MDFDASLNKNEHGYRLNENNKDNWPALLTSGGNYAARHWTLAKKENTSTSEALAHITLAFFEVWPLLGGMIALAERSLCEHKIEPVAPAIPKTNSILKDPPLTQKKREALIGELKKTSTLNTPDQYKMLPLYHAIQNNDIELVKGLIDAGANVNTTNSRGETPLFTAALKGYLKIVQFLITKNANVNLGSKADITPLHMASLNNHKDVVVELLANGAILPKDFIQIIETYRPQYTDILEILKEFQAKSL